MVNFVLLGAALGILFAYTVTKPKRDFKRKLLAEHASYEKTGSGMDFISRLVRDKRQWIRSISWIRKPFRNEVNLAIETAAFILAAVGIFNSVVHFERYFKTAFQGEVAVVFLSAMVMFLPAQRFMEERIEREIESVFNELEDALSVDRVEECLSRARKTWK